MRVLLQRVLEASVKVDKKITGQIKKGLLILIGIENSDNETDKEWIVRKVMNLRIFSDANGQMNKSLKDINGELLIVSQFTLHASVKKGNRPSFTKAAKPEIAKPLYDQTVDCFKEASQVVETGIFGADMKVSLINDGPVTIWLDSKNRE